MRLQRTMPKMVSQVMPITSAQVPAAVSLPQAPKVNEKKSIWDNFKTFLKDTRIISGSLSHLSRMEILQKYKTFLEGASTAANAVGYGKKGKRSTKHIKNPKKLVEYIHQRGGSWSDFTSWVRGAANTVADTAKNVGNKVADASKFVYRRAIRPGLEYARDKPLTTLGYLAKAGSFLPIPGVSQGLSAASTALGAAGTLMGRGDQSGGARTNAYHKVMMVF